MKPPSILLAAIGALALAACSRPAEQASVENNVERVAAELEAKADNLEALADGTANAQAAAMLEGLSDNLADSADNVRDAVD